MVVEKGGETGAIRTAFMRRNLDDWERAEELATRYSRAQIARFSPRSRAILEIQSPRDLEILEKIYANSVLLGDDGPGGWGIRYAREFDMTGDSRLFPPRPQWEAKGYRPDEYSRWLLGGWRPIEELWAELGVDPARPQPAEPELAGWLFDAAAGPERRAAEARFLHGRLLKPGDAARTDWRLRCAAPPYDRLPVPRAALPPGIILSRDADAYLREDQIRGVALPLYQGIMIRPFVPSAQGWISGTGLQAKWTHNLPSDLSWRPQYLMNQDDFVGTHPTLRPAKIGYRRIARSTDARSFMGAILPSFPCGDSVFLLHVESGGIDRSLSAIALLNSFVFDWNIRQRLGATNLSWYVLAEGFLPHDPESQLASGVGTMNLTAPNFSPLSVSLRATAAAGSSGALLHGERLRMRSMIDAVACAMYGCDADDLHYILRDSDLPAADVSVAGRRTNSLDVRGFWRVDRDVPPEHRHTVLTLVALHDLEAAIEAAGGDRERGIRAFLSQNGGAGWLLPETLRLADYGLGRDDRARHPQPVASRLGPRFYDYQLAQTAGEAQRESHLHARNLLGPFRYESLRRGDPYSVPDEQRAQHVAERGPNYAAEPDSHEGQADLFASDNPRRAT